MSLFWLLLIWPVIGFISSILCFIFLKNDGDTIIDYIGFPIFSLVLGPICLWFFIDMYRIQCDALYQYYHAPMNMIGELYKLELVDPKKHTLGKHKIVGY